MKPKLLIVIGTRPEAIKLAPIIKLLETSDIFDHSICITGQHTTMVEQPLALFRITPHHNLQLMKPAQTLAGLSASILEAMMPILMEEKPDFILVQGDTTTAFISALAAFYHQRITIVHVEAGLRTFDKTAPFPEEINRQLIGRLADIHCASTQQAKSHLLREAVPENRIIITGNTAIDALHFILREIQETPKEELQKRLSIPPMLLRRLEQMQNKKLILVTGYRRENFGDGFEQICAALQELSTLENVEIIYPVHLNPNVQKPVYELLANRSNIHLLEPLDYFSFAYLLDKCYLVISDLGGIQEEAPSLGKPVLFMRDVTERPEAVEAGTSIIISNVSWMPLKILFRMKHYTQVSQKSIAILAMERLRCRFLKHWSKFKPVLHLQKYKLLTLHPASMHILFLVSGNAATILQQCGINPASVEEIKIEEKAIASFGKLRAMIKAKPYQGIIWGCRDLEYQRFQPLMKIYMLLCSKGGFIADEQGNINKYGFISFLLKDVTSLVFEVVLSIAVVLFSAIRLPLLKQSVLRKYHKP